MTGGYVGRDTARIHIIAECRQLQVLAEAKAYFWPQHVNLAPPPKD
jgi:hypothetical protein